MITTLEKKRFIGRYLDFARNRSGVRYSTDKGDFIWNSNGRVVSPTKIQRELEQNLERYYDNVERLADRLDNGNLTIAKWQERMRVEIKAVHKTQYIIGRGGRDQMTPRDWGRLGADLRHMHYGALDGMALDIAEGSQSAAQIKARSRLYVSSSNKQFWRGKTEAKIAAGFTEMRRFLNPAEHCVSCISFAASGWVEIDTLPVPGEDSECQANCKCTVKYRK